MIEKLGISLFSGNNRYNTIIDLTDDNYISILNGVELKNNLYVNGYFFQTKYITNLLYNYLRKEEIKSRIIEHNPFKERYNANNDVCVHVRLTDVAKYNPGINYYLHAIKSISYDTLYIATDDHKHDIIKSIVAQCSNVKILDYDEINTFQFASTCKNIILSHGSFSTVIGYLSFFSNVFYVLLYY